MKCFRSGSLQFLALLSTFLFLGLVVRQLVRQLAYSLYTDKNLVPVPSWWRETVQKREKFLKCFVRDCTLYGLPQIVLDFLMFIKDNTLLKVSFKEKSDVMDFRATRDFSKEQIMLKDFNKEKIKMKRGIIVRCNKNFLNFVKDFFYKKI